MQTKKATLYVLDVTGDLDSYARAVLQLTNLKSSVPGSVLHIETVHDTHLVKTISYVELDDFLETYGKVIRKKTVSVIRVIEDDLPDRVLKQLDYEDEAGNDFLIEYSFLGEF
jgi:hypothetical protein